LIAIAAIAENSSVCPSAGAVATICAPRLPPWPGRFSTTTGCFHASANRVATSRASTSVMLPAA